MKQKYYVGIFQRLTDAGIMTYTFGAASMDDARDVASNVVSYGTGLKVVTVAYLGTREPGDYGQLKGGIAPMSATFYAAQARGTIAPRPYGMRYAGDMQGAD